MLLPLKSMFIVWVWLTVTEIPKEPYHRYKQAQQLEHMCGGYAMRSLSVKVLLVPALKSQKLDQGGGQSFKPNGIWPLTEDTTRQWASRNAPVKEEKGERLKPCWVPVPRGPERLLLGGCGLLTQEHREEEKHREEDGTGRVEGGGVLRYFPHVLPANHKNLKL